LAFRETDIMERINRQFCVNGFSSYEDFRNQLNSAAHGQNQAKRRAKELVNTKEKWAIQFIETLREYYCGGLNELTSYMADSLSDALNTLQDAPDSVKDAKFYYQVGKEIADDVEVLVIHSVTVQ